VFRKISALPAEIETVLSGHGVSGDFKASFDLARDVTHLPVRQHPDKKSLTTIEGQARLVHDLASIELQAMELGLRTLWEFPEAPSAFRHELAEVTLAEGKHFQMCLQVLETLGHVWGDWPVHTGLWAATSSQDSLLDRILIVHRYLEGSGLDAGDSIHRRLGVAGDKILRATLGQIFSEEIDHVAFGSRWYRELCRREHLDSENDFAQRLARLLPILPRRMEPLAREKRRAAGFTDQEMNTFESLRESNRR
jgi:uncharacterized ferritin-like protein (DUF455 family)